MGGKVHVELGAKLPEPRWGGRRGRMILLEQRRQVALWVIEARNHGARLEACCEVLGISKRTWPRWVRGEEVLEDKRPSAKRPIPANKLKEEEREQVLAVCR